jgi:hypothetical protein
MCSHLSSPVALSPLRRCQRRFVRGGVDAVGAEFDPRPIFPLRFERWRWSEDDLIKINK